MVVIWCVCYFPTPVPQNAERVYLVKPLDPGNDNQGNQRNSTKSIKHNGTSMKIYTKSIKIDSKSIKICRAAPCVSQASALARLRRGPFVASKMPKFYV